MQGKFPFTDYDFWAYISTGFVFLFTLDHLLGAGLMVRPSWTVVEGLVATACAYAIGHMLAGFASAIIERRIVRKWLGSPSLTVMGDPRGPAWFRWLYPSFYEPMPAKTRESIMTRAIEHGITEPGEALFWVAFDSARSNPPSLARMSDFLNLYGMCRNLSLTGIICAAMLGGAAWWCGRPDDYLWAALGAVLGIGMFFRYLKFYRHYSVEVFTTFAHSK